MRQKNGLPDNRRIIFAWARLMIIACTLLVISITGAQAQLFYDQTTQAVTGWGPGAPAIEVACSNIGQFVIGGNSRESLSLVGNSGETISSVHFSGPDGDNDYGSDQYTIAGIALATNHNSQVAIVGGQAQIIGNYDALMVWHISNTGTNGLIHMRGGILEGSNIVQSLTATLPSAGNIDDISCEMDNDYLYIVFALLDDNCQRDYWYAIANLQDDPSWIVSPCRIPRPVDGAPAKAFAWPTVTCNRWQSGVHSATVAFVTPDPNQNNRPRPAVVTIGQGIAPSSSWMTEPSMNPITACLWVRAVNFDNSSGPSPNHFFYAYAPQPSGGTYLKNTLWATDNSTVWGAISNDLVIRTRGWGCGNNQQLVYPDPAVGDGYVSKDPSLSGSATCYCSFVENSTDAGVQNLRLCRNQGLDAITVKSNPAFAWHSLGCNQMGVFVSYDDGGSNKMWRAFRSFYSDIRENTVASGYCRVAPRSDESTTGLHGIGLGIHTKLNDTMRVLFEDNISPMQMLQFYQPQTNPLPPAPALYSGEIFDPNTVDADPGNSRADILLDQNAIVDFGNVINATLRARSDGVIEYNGSYFYNENTAQIGAEGETRVADTTEKYRGIWYMNAPLSIGLFSTPGTWGIYNNSVFGGVKGQYRFVTEQNQYPYLSFSSGGGMNCDQSFMYLGVDCPTIWTIWAVPFDYQGEFANGNPGAIIFTNGLLSNLWKSSGYYGNDAFAEHPTGYPAGWLITNAYDTKFNNNIILYNHLCITNPRGIVQFNNNHEEGIKQVMELYWSPSNNAKFDGSVQILDNHINSTWPWPGDPSNGQTVDFIIDGFNAGDQTLVKVDNNISFGLADMQSTDQLYNPNSIAYKLENGTNADLTGNRIVNYGVGIDDEIVNMSNSFECSNTIESIGGACTQIRGIGIVHNATQSGGGAAGGACFPKLNTTTNLDVGYVSSGLDASTLIMNSFNNGHYGAQFKDQSDAILWGSHTGQQEQYGYAGFNHFQNNTVSQIGMTDDGAQSAQPKFGPPCSKATDATYGQNTFTTGSAPYFLWQNYPNDASAYVLGSSSDWTLTNSHSSPSIATGTHCTSLLTSDSRLVHFAFNNASPGSVTDPDFTCGGQFLRQGSKSITKLSIESDTSDTLYLFDRALSWDGSNPYFALDTMRLFILRWAGILRQPLNGQADGSIIMALRYCSGFVGEFQDWLYDSLGRRYLDPKVWIDQYNWLTSVYTLDTSRRYRVEVLSQMVGCEYYFNRNEAANLSWNIWKNFPYDSSVCWSTISQIRDYQSHIPEDTTPFHLIAIPPQPYGAHAAVRSHVPGAAALNVLSNPLDKTLDISIALPNAGYGTLELFDPLGREIRMLKQAAMSPGENVMSFDASWLTPGSYYLRFNMGPIIKTVRLTVQY